MEETVRGHWMIVDARYLQSRRRHAFAAGDVSLCGLAHIEECDQLKLTEVSTRLKLYIWPREDLNYCQRCRISLNARGLVV